MSYIRLRHVSVDFPIYQGSSRSLKKALLATSTRGNLARDGLDRITVRALNDLGVALGSRGQMDDAILQFQRALALQPDFAPARHNLTTALQARGR